LAGSDRQSSGSAGSASGRGVDFCSCFVLYVLHPRSFEGVIRGDSVGGAGSGACGSGLINRALGAPRDSTLRAIRPVSREPAGPPVDGIEPEGQAWPERVGLGLTEITAVKRAARRAGPRHGPAVPSVEGTGLTARWPTGAAFRTSALRRFTLLDCFRGGQDGRRPGAERFPGALTLACGLFDK
jgi:hypothetical protein